MDNPIKNEKAPSSLEQSIRSDLKHLKFDFYGDTSGRIYHRIIDYTSGDLGGVYRYNRSVRFYADDSDDFATVELQ